jgi:indolepyruvate ferredoxin oxidoreductase
MNAPLPEHIRQALETVTLDDKYALDQGRAFMSGIHALVKLPMLQQLRDQRVGKNTGGFISGYRGSPLGGYDQALVKAQKYLQAQQHRVPAWRQRGAGGHRVVGYPANGLCPQGQ